MHIVVGVVSQSLALVIPGNIRLYISSVILAFKKLTFKNSFFSLNYHAFMKYFLTEFPNNFFSVYF